MKKSVVIYLHIFFWFALFTSYLLIPPLFLRYLSPDEYRYIAIYRQFLSPIFFYIGYFFTMRIKWRIKYLLLTSFGILALYLILFLISKKAFAYGIIPLFQVFLWTTIGSLFRFFIDWFKKKNDLLILERENISSNLALLKNQINPHFLFNTLHNIDTLIFENQDKASQSLVKLSEIMRYMLKDARSDFVELHKEIDHLEKYMSLEQLRLKNEKFLNYSNTGNFNGLYIAPMILIPFVENAFKHSVDSNIENGIIINISRKNHKLMFACENQFDKSDAYKDNVHGIGLASVKKRLDLIYKRKYKLTINPEKSIFKVNLEIELNEN